MGHQQRRRQRFSQKTHDARSAARHEMFESGGVMMSVHFESVPGDEARQVFQELVEKIASGEIKLPEAKVSSGSAGRILDIRRRAGIDTIPE